MRQKNCGTFLLLAFAFCGQANGAQVQVLNVDNTIHCGTNQGGSNTAAAGPLSGSAGPCGAIQSASTSNFGHLSVSGSVADTLSASERTFGDSVSAYALANYVDPITILNGPSGGYLRMFYDFSYSGTLAPGAGSPNTFDIVYYTAGIPHETSHHGSGTFSGSVSDSMDFQILSGQTIVDGTIYGNSLCTTFVFSSGTDSCSGSFSATFDITGFLVLDGDFQVSQNATIQSLSGATYDGASATPEPQTGILLSTAAGLLFLLSRARRLGKR